MKKLLYIFPVLIIILVSCSKNKVLGPSSALDPCFVNGIDTCNAIKPLIVVNLNDEKQTIDNFGASDCWTTKFIGKWADTQKKDLIADYLFSTDTTTNGQPKGIGLSFWRFNIGGGSFEQGAASGIPDEYRREECFLNPDGTYDWSKHQGQRWFLDAAKKRGINNFLAYSLTPPVQYTINNKAYGLAKAQLNLKPGFENAYANFLVDVVQHFNQSGYNMRYLSPFNEPQNNWGANGASQEGTAATNSEIASFVKVLGPKLKQANSQTTITLSEAAQWNFLNTSNQDNRGNQLNDFFNPGFANYIGNVPQVEKLMSAHSYFTTCPNDNLIKIREDALNAKNQLSSDLRLWETEFGILGDVCGQYSGYPKNTGIDYGLYVAKVIHHDLAIANVSAWQWWLAVSPYNYSDALVYINDLSGGYNLNACKTDGLVSDSKQLWCLGNYSRFVRPGMVRIGASLNTVKDLTSAAATQMVTAYKDKINKKIVIVIINMEALDKKFSLDPTSSYMANKQLKSYTTSSSASLSKSVVDSGNILIPGKSVVTLVGNYK